MQFFTDKYKNNNNQKLLYNTYILNNVLPAPTLLTVPNIYN